jgi:hypothetical protein
MLRWFAAASVVSSAGLGLALGDLKMTLVAGCAKVVEFVRTSRTCGYDVIALGCLDDAAGKP